MTEEKHTNLVEEVAENTEQQALVSNLSIWDKLARLVSASLVELDDCKVLKCRRISHILRKFFDISTRTQYRNYVSLVKHHSKVKFKQYTSTVPRMLSLFFGLCCSSPLYIFDAIFGNSSTRIFSLN